MPDTDNKVLACVDRSRFSGAIADYAAWAARRLAAPLEFLHVLDHHPERGSGDDHSGAIGVDAQEKLLERLSSADEARTRALRDEGRVFLNRLREQALAAGVASVDIRQRHGSLQETVALHEHGVRLLVIGRQGESAQGPSPTGRLGGNLERIVRAMRKPVLAVPAADAGADFTAPQRVLIAFDGGAIIRRGVEMIASSPLFRGQAIHLLMAGTDSRVAISQLERAHHRLAKAGFDTTSERIEGDPQTVIAAQVAAQGFDLVVMGAYSHSPWRSLFMGSKTTELLRRLQLPTLLLG